MWSKSRGALSIYKNSRVVGMLFLGFSAGLPILLVFGTLSFWLREAGVSRSTIGFFSWIGLAYAVKWCWSPLVDRMKLPVLTNWLGRRRAWLLLSQIAIIFSLVCMAITDPAVDLRVMAGCALLVAVSSATQDIALDAYRIEAVPEEMQGAMSASYMAGYRLGMILASAGTLAIAAIFDPSEASYEHRPWQIAYLSMAACMLVGIISTLMTTEPDQMEDTESSQRKQKLASLIAHYQHLPAPLAHFLSWFLDAVISPFWDFIKRYGWHALLILFLIGTYRISDIVLGIMANPFYYDMGFTKGEVAGITKVYGVIMTIVGAGVGGLMIVRWGVLPILFLGAVLSAGSNLLFSVLAGIGHDIWWLTAVISFDNFSAGIATAAFVAYLSSLTNVSYSATQYALFSSVMLLLPKFMAGFSGVVVDNIGYSEFFVGTALLGVPVLILIMLAMKFIPARNKS
ncbi:MAG: MFS transporter [Gammaproteobacteria bacterium]